MKTIFLTLLALISASLLANLILLVTDDGKPAGIAAAALLLSFLIMHRETLKKH